MNDTQERIDKIQQILHLHTLGFLELGALFAEAESAGDHKKLGFKRMAQFAASMNLLPQRYYQIAQVYRLFVKYIKADPSLRSIEFTRLRQLATIVEKMEDRSDDVILDYLHTAKTAPNRSYIAFIETLKGKPDQEACEHPETTTITRCKQCGMKIGETNGILPKV